MLLSHIDSTQYDFVDFSQVGSAGSGTSTRSFSILNNAASVDASAPLRFGSILGYGGQYNAAKSLCADIHAYQAGITLSAIEFDSGHAAASDITSDSLAAVGSVQLFSQYVSFNPIFVYQMTVQSSDATQLAKDINYNYFREDLTVNNARKLTQSSTLQNRPQGSNSDVNIFLTKQLGGLYLSSMNYLEFTSLKAKDYTINFDIGAIAVIGQMKILM